MSWQITTLVFLSSSSNTQDETEIYVCGKAGFGNAEHPGPVENQAPHTTPCKLCRGQRYTLKCLDSYGDGWVWNGDRTAMVELQGNKFCDDFVGAFPNGYSRVLSFTIDTNGQLLLES